MLQQVSSHTVTNSSIRTKHLYLILTFRSHHDIFIRRSWYSVLPSLDVTICCRIKKAVVGVTHLITALVSIHSSMTFLADMYSFLDPPGRTVLFSVDDRSLFPVDCVIGLMRSKHQNKVQMFGCDWWIFNRIVIPTKWSYFLKGFNPCRTEPCWFDTWLLLSPFYGHCRGQPAGNWEILLEQSFTATCRCWWQL